MSDEVPENAEKPLWKLINKSITKKQERSIIMNTLNFLVNNKGSDIISKIKSRMLLKNHRKIYAGEHLAFSSG